MKNIRTTCMFFLSGILGIIAFFNTAAIEQAKLLEVGDEELSYLVDGINRSSFYLLITCIFFFIALLPIEEIVYSFKGLATIAPSIEETKKKRFDVFHIISAVSFSIGFIGFSVLFIIYIFKFIPLI